MGKPSVKALRKRLSGRVADKDEAAGAADATAWVSREISGTADVVWVIGKGDSCDPFTQDDAGWNSRALRRHVDR